MKLSPRFVTTIGLLGGAVGIAILWAGGVDFPVYPPPGIILLVVGALVVASVDRVPALVLGTILGLFVLVGSIISPTGRTNLMGDAGATIAIGQAIQGLGVLTALIAGVIATRRRLHARG